MYKFITACFVVCTILLTSCSSTFTPTIDPVTDTIAPPTLTPSLTASQTATSTLTLAPTETPTATFTATPTLEPSPTVTPTWILNNTGKVIAPILLYHHIADIDPPNRYYISPKVFQEQMEALKSWGYTALPISTIVETIMKGGELPERPVVITFDDGNEDVYTNAFPIMQKLGFVGTFFIVGKTVGADKIVTVDQLDEMIAAGWEVGSHSMSHQDLTKMHDNVQYEIGMSKANLEKELNTKVHVFAYPYGIMDSFLVTKVQNYGYLAAVGLGTTYEHGWSTLYYLSRIEVQYSYDLEKFGSILPWQGPISPP
jgi:peptidoglycan/xylan/chitin deacetylase (PgdA/CDA1 family)